MATLASALLFGVLATVADDALIAGAESGQVHATAVPDEVQAAVEQYSKILQDFFASGGGPALIDELPASRDLKHHLFRDIGFVRDAGMVLVQDLASAQVVEVKRTGPHAAQLTQYEEWNYVFQDAADRKPLSQVKGLGQGFRYDLVEREGRWIIVGWDLADVPRPADDGARKW